MIQLQAVETADTELEWQDSGREKVVEQNFRSILRVHLDDVEKYGLEHCLYFQALRTFCQVYFLISFLSIFQMMFALEGTRFADNDFFSTLATLTMGNTDESTALSAGTLHFRLSSGADSISIGVCLVLQLFFPALALVLLVSYLWRRLAGHPDLTSDPSVADYAMEVRGLPNSASESEVLSHFETLLRECPDFEASGGATVCDVVVARDFRGALLCAMEQQVLESRDAAREVVAKHALRLRKHQMEENQRPVMSAFLVLSTELERDWLMQRYRWAFPLFRYLQWSSKRYCGRWPLYVRAAPEPCDIIWAHYLDYRWFSRVSVAYQLLIRSITICLLLLVWGLTIGISWLIWWLTLDHQLVFGAMQCTMWDSTCECCACDNCAWTPVGVVANWLVSEVACFCGSWLMQWHSKFWRCSRRSGQESGKMILMVLAQSGSAICPAIGLWLLKLSWAYRILEPPGDTTAKWQGDLSLYLYAIPVVELWCSSRWLLVLFHGLRSCVGKPSQRFVLWRQYASLVSVLGTTLFFQTLAPILTPLTALGLLLRYWSEKIMMVNGAMTVRCGTPVRLALHAANTAAGCLWIAIIIACGLSFGMFWTGEWSMASPAAFVGILGMMLVGYPLLEWLYSQIFWISCGIGSPPNTWRPPVRSAATRWNQAAPPRMSYHEAWLIMRHKSILSSYSFSDHPDFHRSNVLQRLQPDGIVGDVRKDAVARMGRSVDMTCSRAVVLEKAPTRGPTQGAI